MTEILQTAIDLAAQVNINRLMDDVVWLADDARQGRKTGSSTEDIVGDWLVERFQGMGLTSFTEAGVDSYSLPFPVYSTTSWSYSLTGENIIAVLPGVAHPARYVFISAHYDHLGVSVNGEVYNGADDDATGVAAVLEIARIIHKSGLQPQKTLVFVAFSGEEQRSVGSQALCKLLKSRDLISQSVLLNLEVLGAETGKGTYLDAWDEDSPVTGPIVEAVQLAGGQIDFPVQRRGRDPGSDALVMLSCGVPAISMDVAWSWENHPYYHQPSDDPEYIDQDGFQKAVQVALIAVWLLANDGR